MLFLPVRLKSGKGISSTFDYQSALIFQIVVTIAQMSGFLTFAFIANCFKQKTKQKMRFL